MKALKDIPLRLSYRTGRDDLVRDFYVPCLSVSILYRRAAGYFTSAGLAVAANGVANLVSRNGKMKLVASPHLDAEDIAALQTAKNDPQMVLRSIAAKGLQEIQDVLIYDRLNALAWLSAAGLLEVKLALRIDKAGNYTDGIYHEKMGVLSDSADNHVTFSGSSNETAGGLVSNFESIKVFRSWNDPEGRAQEDIDDFEALWNNTTPGLEVLDFTDASEELLQRYKNRRQSISHAVPKRLSDGGFPLWPHQEAALEKFLEQRVGIIEMATGTGKTRLATAICERLESEGEVQTIIVATDGTDLLNQWYAVLLNLIKRFKNRWAIHRHYESHKGRDDFLLSPERSVLLVSRQFLASALKALNKASLKKTILIHDEVHRLGSPSNRAALAGLSTSIPYRLGLSATPEREYDSDGNAFIAAEVGEVIYKFGLEEAIEKGILAPFEYHPIYYCPDEEDGIRIQGVYAKKAARERDGNSMSKEELWTEIAKVYKTSKAKLPPFRDFIALHSELLTRCIVFVETKEYGEEVLDIIHSYHHEFHTYFANEDAETLKRFARGDIQCLLTCHRLSEGIDIQSLSSVILFSSARARLETIQRMGRCLRKDPTNPEKIAHVVDFIRSDNDETADRERAEWLVNLSKIRPIQ